MATITTTIGTNSSPCVLRSAKADDWDSCNRRVAYVEFRLHESIVYFGYYSPQANYWRHERHEAFEQLERYRRRDRDRD
jgi:hypothetical protein